MTAGGKRFISQFIFAFKEERKSSDKKESGKSRSRARDNTNRYKFCEFMHTPFRHLHLSTFNLFSFASYTRPALSQFKSPDIRRLVHVMLCSLESCATDFGALKLQKGRSVGQEELAKFQLRQESE